MCGIAGAVDLTGQRRLPEATLRRMADAIVHRGPDEDGYFQQDGVALANRRLSIVGLADGRQPIANEDQTVWTVYNGELFDYPEMRADLEARGHRFRTHTDTELIPHLWEDHGEGTRPWPTCRPPDSSARCGGPLVGGRARLPPSRGRSPLPDSRPSPRPQLVPRRPSAAARREPRPPSRGNRVRVNDYV